MVTAWIWIWVSSLNVGLKKIVLIVLQKELLFRDQICLHESGSIIMYQNVIFLFSFESFDFLFFFFKNYCLDKKDFFVVNKSFESFYKEPSLISHALYEKSRLGGGRAALLSDSFNFDWQV